MAAVTEMPLDSVRLRLRQFGLEVEHWNSDHQNAMRCMEFELLLRHALNLLEQIHRADEKVRALIFRGEMEFDPAFEESLRAQYEAWLKPSPAVLARLERYEGQGFTVECAAEFRMACREVEGIVRDDAAFFSSDKLVQLRDQAIDEHRAGQCAPA